MSDIATWYLARLDEDEQLARQAKQLREGELWVVTGADVPVGVNYDPAHVLADIAAKRRIVQLYQNAIETTGCGLVGLDGGVFLALDEVVHLLAAAMSDRPGCDPAWAPREES